MHSISTCECCRTTTTVQFPVQHGHKNSLKKREPFTQLNVTANKSISKSANTSHKPLVKEIKKIGQEIYKNFNKVCQENLGQSLADVLCHVPEAQLQKKVSPAERKKKNRNIKRKFKTNVEETWQQNDVNSHLEQRTSYRARNMQRFNQSFETPTDAKQRVAERKEKKVKSHSPKYIAGDLEELLDDFHTWTPGKPINWTAKARQFNIKKKGGQDTPQNAGQLLKTYLKNQGLNITPFEKEGAGR